MLAVYFRTQTIRWKYVMINFIQVIAVTFYTYFIYRRFIIPEWYNFGKDKMTTQAMIVHLFACMIPGNTLLCLAFFGLLHSWLNAFAEMLRFADRMFYQVSLVSQLKGLAAFLYYN